MRNKIIIVGRKRMKSIRNVATVILVVNSIILCMPIALFVLKADLSSGSPLDLFACLTGYYCVFVLPVTTIAAIIILCIQSAIRAVGWVLIALGSILLLANYSVLVEGHRVVIHKRDTSGAIELDAFGNPIDVLNPVYGEFLREQSIRGICAIVMVLVGASILFLNRRRNLRDAQPVAQRNCPRRR